MNLTQRIYRLKDGRGIRLFIQRAVIGARILDYGVAASYNDSLSRIGSQPFKANGG
jgi:hypothetical protein